MPEAYSDLFWNGFLVVSLVVLFWVAIREDSKEDSRDPDPSQDVTKIRSTGCYTRGSARPAEPHAQGGPARGRR